MGAIMLEYGTFQMTSLTMSSVCNLIIRAVLIGCLNIVPRRWGVEDKCRGGKTPIETWHMIQNLLPQT